RRAHGCLHTTGSQLESAHVVPQTTVSPSPAVPQTTVSPSASAPDADLPVLLNPLRSDVVTQPSRPHDVCQTTFSEAPLPEGNDIVHPASTQRAVHGSQAAAAVPQYPVQMRPHDTFCPPDLAWPQVTPMLHAPAEAI